MATRSIASLLLSFAAAVVACAAPPFEAPGRAKDGPSESDASHREPVDAAASDADADAGVLDTIDASTDATSTEPRPPRVVELGYRIDKVYREPHHQWRQVQTLNWQIADPLAPLPAEPKISPGRCAEGMIPIAGGLLLDKKGHEGTDGVLELQDGTCEAWRVKGRICDRFSETRWRAIAATLARKPLRFCVDRYEYPNRRGEYPLVVTTFSEAERYCKKEGKRLCDEDEWTLACEGEEGRPYPYGYARDATACPIDRARIEPPEDTFVPRTNGHTARGIDTMWLGERSGAFARCTSPYGVADTTGNVDEWTRSTRKWGYKTILKGGHWAWVRGRCRPQTRGHGPLYVNVETGFRCCTDAPPE